MRIALVATVEETIPPTRYGGVERIAFQVAQGMSDRGHQVDILASGDSPAGRGYNVIPITPRSLRKLSGATGGSSQIAALKMAAMERAVEIVRNGKYDVIHNHASWRFLAAWDKPPANIVTTHHGLLSHPDQNAVFLKHRHLPFVSISDNQRRDLPKLNYAATVYNGVNLADYPFRVTVKPDAPMAYLTRMNYRKGAIDAAKVARQTSHPLEVGAKVDSEDKPYFQRFMKLVDGKAVRWKGELGLRESKQMLEKAKCLLVPIRWEEPFGLMFIESMAAGTPVISFARGAAPEIILDRSTGYLVNESVREGRGDFLENRRGLSGLRSSVKRMYAAPPDQYATMRRAARQHVEKHFSSEVMVRSYERVFRKVVRK